MPSDDDTAEMIQACITAAEHVNRSGSPELRSLMRMLLFLLGAETAQRQRAKQQGADGADGEARAQSDKDRLN